MTLILEQTASLPQAATTKAGAIEVPAPPAPGGFDATLWTLLQDIKSAGVALTGKVAEYAGFYRRVDQAGSVETRWDASTDNKNKPDVPQQPIETANGQPNKSLDKLTFLIMFRLAYRTKTPGVYHGDPINGPATSWSYRANQLRTGTLRRLNQAGEQVNSSNQRCDDSGVPLDNSATGELNTPAAYAYYDNVGANLSGAVATAVKSQPLFLYLTVTTEGAFSATPGDTMSVVQVPENIVGLMGKNDKAKKPPPVLRRREVELGIYSGTANVLTPSTSIADFATTYPVDGCLVKKETTGAHANEYYVLPTSPAAAPRVYVELKYSSEVLAKNDIHSLGATVFELEGLKIQKVRNGNADTYYATYYTTKGSRYKFGFAGPGDIQFDNLAIVNRSGVTMGWGFDIGQGSREDYQYQIRFTIWKAASLQPAGTTKFALRYKDESASIAFTAGPAELEKALLSLLGLKATPWPDEKNTKGIVTRAAPKTITVTPAIAAGDVQYPTGWAVTIIRTNMDPKESSGSLYSDQTGACGFFNMYSSSVFYHRDPVQEGVQPNIKITPPLEKDRYAVNTSPSAVASWTKFTALLDNLCGGQDWRDGAHFEDATAQDISEFESALRGCYGIRRGNAFLPVFNHYSLLKKFRLPGVELLFPRWITFFIKPRYYDAKAANLPADVKNRTNAAEKYVLTTIAYGGDLGSNKELNEAIKTKDLTKLVEVVKKRNKGDTLAQRRGTIVDHLNGRFKKHLYRNIEEG